MKKIILPLLCISTLINASETDNLLPPPYSESANNYTGASSSSTRQDPTTLLEQHELNLFFNPLNEGNVPEMIRVAGFYEDGDQKNMIPPNIFYCLGLLSLATAYETDGSASWQIAETLLMIDNELPDTAKCAYGHVAHAAYLQNPKALRYMSGINKTRPGTIKASKDLYADVFAEIVKNRNKYSAEELYNHACSFFKGTNKINPQPIHGLAIATYLEKKYPKEWYGPQLLMGFALGKTKDWKQNIVPPNATIAKKIALENADFAKLPLAKPALHTYKSI